MVGGKVFADSAARDPRATRVRPARVCVVRPPSNVPEQTPAGVPELHPRIIINISYFIKTNNKIKIISVFGCLLYFSSMVLVVQKVGNTPRIHSVNFSSKSDFRTPTN